VARVEMDSFEEGTEIVRVYLAAALDEARTVEAALDAAGAEYAVEVEALPSSGLLAGRARRAAGFWVRAGALDACADALERAGLVRGLVDRGAR
jgi:hypothetical protein